MALATITNVRALGRLPDSEKLTDADVQVQLDSAARELKSWIDTYESTTDADKANACVEAESCICMAYLLPVINTLFTQESTVLQRQIGETDFLFLSPEDTQTQQEYWMNRARGRMAEYMSVATGGGWFRYAVVDSGDDDDG